MASLAPLPSVPAPCLRRWRWLPGGADPGWDEHYSYPNNNPVSPDTQLHWSVCKQHCLFDVGTGGDIAETRDLAADPEHGDSSSSSSSRRGGGGGGGGGGGDGGGSGCGSSFHAGFAGQAPSDCRHFSAITADPVASDSSTKACPPTRRRAAATLASLLDRFWQLSNSSGSAVCDPMFDAAQCADARAAGFWRPADYSGPAVPNPLPPPPRPPPPPPANHSGHWVTRAGRSGCGGKRFALPGRSGLRSVGECEAHCDALPSCAFFVFNAEGQSGGHTGDGFFCTVDRFGDTKPSPGWVTGHRVAFGGVVSGSGAK